MARRTAKRGHGEGAIYKRTEKRQKKDGAVVGVERWCAAVSLEGGRRKVLYGRTRKEVADKLAAALKDASGGLPLPSLRLSTAKYLEDWLEQTVKPGLHVHTYLTYKTMIERHITPLLGKIPLARVAPQDVQRLQNKMAEDGKSPATIMLARAALSGALSQAEKWGLVTRNVVRLVDPPASEDRDPKVLDPEQCRAVRQAARGDELEPLFSLLLATGLRIGEALGLRWQDVDMDSSVPALRVRQQAIFVRGQGRYLDDPKSRTGKRTVPLVGLAVEALRAQRDRQAFQRHATGGLWQDRDLVFSDDLGGLLPYSRAEDAWHRVRVRAGIQERLTLHSLRHSAATYLTAAGVPDRTVMAILGHSSTAMTLRYQHVVGTMLSDAGQRLEAFFQAM